MGNAVAGGLEQQVGRLDVAVHQPCAMHGSQAHEQLLDEECDRAGIERSVLAQQVGDRAARHDLHREHDEIILRGPAVRRHHVRVAHPDRLLAHEARQERRAVLAEDLQRHVAPGALVEGPPHRSHATGADLVEQHVAPRHHGGCPGGGPGRV